jgi:hypothetical protein
MSTDVSPRRDVSAETWGYKGGTRGVQGEGVRGVIETVRVEARSGIEPLYAALQAAA